MLCTSRGLDPASSPCTLWHSVWIAIFLFFISHTGHMMPTKVTSKQELRHLYDLETFLFMPRSTGDRSRATAERLVLLGELGPCRACCSVGVHLGTLGYLLA